MLRKQHTAATTGETPAPDNPGRRIFHVGLLMTMAIGVAVCQTATSDRLTFEVASVKPAKPDTGRYTMKGGPGTSDPDRITYTNIMLRAILLSAYDVKNYQVSGPEWIDTLRFDITAKLPSLEFCILRQRFCPFHKGLEDLSSVRIQSGVAENPFLPGRMA
jgi:hypothetical protein